MIVDKQLLKEAMLPGDVSFWCTFQATPDWSSNTVQIDRTKVVFWFGQTRLWNSASSGSSALYLCSEAANNLLAANASLAARPLVSSSISLKAKSYDVLDKIYGDGSTAAAYANLPKPNSVLYALLSTYTANGARKLRTPTRSPFLQSPSEEELSAILGDKDDIDLTNVFFAIADYPTLSTFSSLVYPAVSTTTKGMRNTSGGIAILGVRRPNDVSTPAYFIGGPTDSAYIRLFEIDRSAAFDSFNSWGDLSSKGESTIIAVPSQSYNQLKNNVIPSSHDYYLVRGSSSGIASAGVQKGVYTPAYDTRVSVRTSSTHAIQHVSSSNDVSRAKRVAYARAFTSTLELRAVVDSSGKTSGNDLLGYYGSLTSPYASITSVGCALGLIVSALFARMETSVAPDIGDPVPYSPCSLIRFMRTQDWAAGHTSVRLQCQYDTSSVVPTSSKDRWSTLAGASQSSSSYRPSIDTSSPAEWYLTVKFSDSSSASWGAASFNRNIPRCSGHTVPSDNWISGTQTEMQHAFVASYSGNYDPDDKGNQGIYLKDPAPETVGFFEEEVPVPYVVIRPDRDIAVNSPCFFFSTFGAIFDPDAAHVLTPFPADIRLTPASVNLMALLDDDVLVLGLDYAGDASSSGKIIPMGTSSEAPYVTLIM